MKAILLILSLALPSALRAQESATLEGAVLRTGTADPVPRSRVILNPLLPDSTPQIATTDEAGRFAFRGVPQGRYQLVATHDGYVRAGAPIALASRQIMQNIVLAITPMGAISGRIWNRLNEPISNAAVRALRLDYEAGRPVLTAIQTVRTNDLGEYRLYYLEPGQYVVSALPFLGPQPLPSDGPLGLAGVDMLPGNPAGEHGSNATRSGIFTAARQLTSDGFVSTAETGETYLPTFFPGVPDASGALPIRIDPGATIGTVNFILAPVRAVNIRGQVTNGLTGQPQRGVAVVLLSPGSGSDGIPVDRYGFVSESGAFAFNGVAPGIYDIVASVGRLPAGMSPIPSSFAGGASINHSAVSLPAAPVNEPRLAGRLSIKAGGADLDNVPVTLQSGYTLNGRITVEGRTPADSESLTAGVVVQLQPDPPDIVPESNPPRRVQTASMPVAAGSGGAFSTTGVFPGTYRIGLYNAVRLPRNAYVKSARLGDADALSPRLRIDGTPTGLLEIVIGTNPASIDARVMDERASPVPAVSVILVPNAPLRQRYELYRSAVSDEAGRVHLDNVISGDYVAYALQQVQDGSWWDPEFTTNHEGRGQPVHISEGGAQTFDLKFIQARGQP